MMSQTWVLFKRYPPSGARDLLAGGKHRNSLNVGLEFCLVLILCLTCGVIAPLWLEFLPGLDKPVEVNGNIFIPLAHAECLRDARKAIYCISLSTNSPVLKDAVELHSSWICATLPHCQRFHLCRSWSTEWQNCRSSAKPSCNLPSHCSFITLMSSCGLMWWRVSLLTGHHRDWKIVSSLWLFSSPKISRGFQHSVSFVSVNESKAGNTSEEFVFRLVSHSL